MANITDIIEEYIKARIGRSNSGVIIFRRGELAEKFSCVPSQINYVLSTRFSSSRGYIVETRRGGGGFIRIIRIPLEDSEELLDIVYEKIGDQIGMNEAIGLIRYLFEEDIISRREAHLMETVIEVAAPDHGHPEARRNRAVILKSMLMVLLRHKK
ncbi:CtsR family transcriptional regulator [Phosphitispora fastidiosa]|uniref:CtsR family transcriptional regulator n=1 Tax=Phosphitispora fastidiosa TaxID=2837202 RepID=UPI001E5F6BB1|nr:CtsR family transcriptional regulator [Phosphitispora fastidiosa]MBU7007501.1 transcriptional regulator CtsR [Phosphitispora fastidiosa]